jgi:uncharacterized protein (TIGR02594 family)
MQVTALDLARRYEGVAELRGGLDNPHILAWLMDAGVASPRNAPALYRDETPYCGAFVFHIARLLELPRPILPARARSWLTVGKPVELAAARPGFDIVILQRGDGAQPGPEVVSAPGHVGFFVGLSSDGHVRVFGANQSDRVCLAPFPRARVLGARRLLEEV